MQTESVDSVHENIFGRCPQSIITSKLVIISPNSTGIVIHVRYPSTPLICRRYLCLGYSTAESLRTYLTDVSDIARRPRAKQTRRVHIAHSFAHLIKQANTGHLPAVSQAQVLSTPEHP